jgi:hypothetical protein
MVMMHFKHAPRVRVSDSAATCNRGQSRRSSSATLAAVEEMVSGLGAHLSFGKRTHMLVCEPVSVEINMTQFIRIVAISSWIIVASMSLPTAWAEDIAQRTAVPSALSDSAGEASSSPHSAPSLPASALA